METMVFAVSFMKAMTMSDRTSLARSDLEAPHSDLRYGLRDVARVAAALGGVVAYGAVVALMTR
jgi:hypothetical protein